MSDHTWNYRLMQYGGQWGIYEVYYDDDAPVAFVETPILGPYDEVWEVLDELPKLTRATEEGTLVYRDGEGFSEAQPERR